ncbi:MAG: hypothetical protein IJY79_05530 [Clostridia bacterium]|nr:hypothetical protein [Clostridia bacterium]
MKNKKIIIIIAAVVLAVAILVTGIVLISKNLGDTTVYLDEKKALAGDTVQIPLSISKNHGIWGGQIIINYDSDAISFVSCSNGEVFDECEVNNNVGEVVILVTQSELEDTKESGLIANLNFKVKVSADKGDYDIIFNAETNFCDSDENMVEPILKKGVISVK